MAEVNPFDALLVGCIGAPAASTHNSDVAIAALVALVEEFVSSPEQVQQMTQYLLHRDRDVYLGYFAPTTIQ